MAVRKTINLLPSIFQTDVNRKFLSATVDQLVSEPSLKNIYGYIGRKFAPTYKNTDSYIVEDSLDRQNYQLEPSIVVRDDQKNITFFANYIDFLDKIRYYGGFTNDQDRLFNNEYYSFDPRISFDKLVNFSQYYWLKDGPAAVDVNTSGVPFSKTFTVTRNAATDDYVFTSGGEIVDTITLARGGRYTFELNQAGNPFWIQTELGIDGQVNNTPNISTREILGVTNNGEDVGTIVFDVPQLNAQDRFTTMPLVYNVDYAAPIPYTDLHNNLLSIFLDNYPQYAGITGQLDGKTLIFVDQENFSSLGENVWTAKGLYDNEGFQVGGYDAGTVVPESQRYGIWRVQFFPSNDPNDPIVRLVPIQNINLNEKVFVKYGIANANKEFFKDFDGFLHRVPVLTSLLETLYIQDGTSAGMYTSVKIVQPTSWAIDVENDILGKLNYTSPNGVKFTSGLKIRFSTDVTPATYQNKEYYVEGIGDSIRLVDTEILVTPENYNDELELNFPDTVFPDYITINRSHLDLNAWSRNNRWFHRDVIAQSAELNGQVPVYDQTLRAQRPIIQFEGDIQLFNAGRIGKRHIDILDTQTKDAFSELEGKVLESAFGVPLVDGIRILFAADNDPLVRDKIYVLTLEQYELDQFGFPTGEQHIKLTIADDGDSQVYDSIVVTQGQYKGSQWWYDGVKWNESQQKNSVNQAPLFDVFDTSGTSYSTYERSNFTGTQIFGYKPNSAGVIDPVLGFALSYRNFGTQGDIEFQNFFENNTFSFLLDQNITTKNISTGFLHKIIDRETVTPRNVWDTVVEDSKQYQIISYTYNGNPFLVDVAKETESGIPYIKVYQNNVYLRSNQWTLTNNEIVLSTTLNYGDKVDILIYSHAISELGYYQVPLNLDLNAQNIILDNVTLGQMRNHLVTLSQNSTIVEGDILATSNLRDIEIKAQGGNILQHSAPLPYGVLFLLDDTANFIDSLRYAQQEYARFKNKFLELSTSLSGINPTDPVASVDLILTQINNVKNRTFPWYYSDMVPYGTLKSVVSEPGYTIFDPLINSYEITNIFNDTILSNLAVLVYLTKASTGEKIQLVKNVHYEFSTERPAITLLTDSRITFSIFADGTTLEVDDLLEIVEYSNTDGNYIPETPTKLGLYPKFVPEIFLDDTYREPINVIRGHDGSLTPVFGDYRDGFLLELEKRIYNNIKQSSESASNFMYSVLPGKFRNSRYTNDEFNQLLSASFLSWVGNNSLDFSTNVTFQTNDAFTWNYSSFIDRVSGEELPGSWRACYQYFYDTLRPHLTPWEMLGFSTKPTWWEDEYGPAPYTGGNKYLWDDLEAGRIRQGNRAGIDPLFTRPGLSQFIPVDENGFLLSPAQIMTATFNSKYASTSWAIGDIGPTEAAWRNSSDFPYAVQRALAVAVPGKYFSQLLNTYDYSYNRDLEQFLTRDNKHINQSEITFNGNSSNGTLVRSSGYLNWIADYLIGQGIDPATKILPMLQNYEVNLSYKLAGFSDQQYLQVLAEQSSPTSTNDSVLIPNENYTVKLHKSSPVDKLIYSAVIVEKTTSGWTVRGYDLTNPYFTIIPSVVNSNSYSITVLNSRVSVWRDFQNLKLNVPYGYEFKSQQQVADFLISYERYLVAQGFTFEQFDEQLGERKDWKLSVKEFLFWVQQGWKPGSIIVLSPVSDSIDAVVINATTDEITDKQYGSRVVDQNFKLVKNINYTVLRDNDVFKLTLINDAILGYAEINLVQYEHALIFDNATVFNDIIYKPELGNRQYRLKLVGQKTAEWNGSLHAPGFVYSSGDVDTWLAGRDYLKGDLVQYKNRFYTALEDIPAAADFNFSQWQEISNTEIRKGLIPNWASLAERSKSYYDSYGYFNDAETVKFSHGLIGFKPRQYLDDLGLNETTQIELYKGFIKTKGTRNAVTELTSAEFNNLSSSINLYEEWAIRVGEYGALNINPYLEIALDEKAFAVNPGLAEFVGKTRNNDGDGVTVFNKAQLYKSTDQYNGNVALNRDDYSNYDNDLPTAGYVNIDDVDTTIFDLADFQSLNDKLDVIGSGYTIWCAKDFTQKWNVYRVTETDINIELVSNALDGYVTFETNVPHKLNTNDVFLVRNFDPAFDGFYQVYKPVGVTGIMVAYSGNTDELDTLEGNGILFTLDSLRFDFMETARKYVPPHGWKPGEKIWIDRDAPTTFVQGQPYETGNNLWKVYEKTMPWNVTQSLDKQASSYVANDGFGTSVKLSADLLLSVVGSPFAQTKGIVTTFLKNSTGQYAEGYTLTPTGVNTEEFGTSVDLSTDRLAVGAPGSDSDRGYVYIYDRKANPSTFDISQIIVGTNAAGRFGHSVALDETGSWLYVGALGEDTVYVYGLNTHVTNEEQTVTKSNVMMLTLSSTITANVGDLLLQSTTGAVVELLSAPSANANVLVSSLTNINFGISAGNITIQQLGPAGNPISSTNYNIYPVSATQSYSSNTIGLTFTPSVANTASSLLITTATKTFIPDVDYTVSGPIVTFTSNVAPDDYRIKQQPYYSLVTTITEPGIEFGFCVDSSYDGAQLAVGAPGDTVNGLAQAGSVFVYDRVIEAFNSFTDAVPGTSGQDYQTDGTIGLVHRVTIDGIEVTNYLTHLTDPSLPTNIVRFIDPPLVGKVIFIETNAFNLLEKLIGIDSLEGGLSSIQSGARFGTSLTICSNNCAIYVGAPFYNQGTIYNTGAVWKFHNRGRLYGTNTGYAKNPTFTKDDTIRLDNFVVTATNISTPASTTVSLDDLVQNINDANILGVSAVNENGYLRLDSDRTVAKNLLRILSGTGTIFEDSEMAIFAFMQIIINPYNAQNEYFGSKVILAPNAYMLVISSDRGTTRKYTTFDDNTTQFDNDTTAWFDKVNGSGSVYIYELYDDPRDEVENPGRYAYAQQLNPGDLNAGDKFGYAIDIIGDEILVSSPADDTTVEDAGSVYLFKNPARTRGWNLIRYQQPKVDVESVNRLFLYSNLTNTILSNMEFIDPAKGKILGAAEQEIFYKTEYDPAVYNRGTRTNITLSDDRYWNERHIGEVWWDLSLVRYIDYEQDTLTYRSINWGRLFPNSTISVCEWVESDVLPNLYVETYPNQGAPKYGDDSAYVEVFYVDTLTNTVRSKYYFWVEDKPNLDQNLETRNIPLVAIKALIENPKSNGTPYAAIIQNNAVIVYNVGPYLSADNTILHIDYSVVKNSSIIHSEYELVQKGNPDSIISPKIINKFIDSLSGADSNGAVVPDPALSLADRYGISTRPRQSVFKDRIAAMANLIDYVNAVLTKYPVAVQYDLSQLLLEEPIPKSKVEDPVNGEYNQTVDVESELNYIDTTELPTDYRVLVLQDTGQNNLWVIYTLQSDKTWLPYKVQSYKTNLYWNYVDWYAEGYDPSDKVEYVVDTYNDVLKLAVAIGDEVLVRVTQGENDGWVIVTATADGFKTVGIQNGTIQLSSVLGDFTNSDIGFGNQGYETARYDSNPNIEIRNILYALRDNIFINELAGEFNNTFFVMINYLFNEQKFVDWIFKTSFVSVTHQLRELTQFPNYIKDNQTYYQSYIEEVKPYSAKLREYLISYNSTDEYAADITDFDLPGYYDAEMRVFRSPSGEEVEKDEALWANPTGPYNQWYQNRNPGVDSIIVEDSGSGYTFEPTIEIIGGGIGAIGATARAVIDGDTGAILRIDVTNSGTGYYLTPRVIVNGSYATPARAYAVLKNNQVRSISTTMKFDRITYNSSVVQWQPATNYTANTIVSYNGIAYKATENIYNSATFTLSGNVTVAIGDYITQNGYEGSNVTVATVAVDSKKVFVSNITGLFEEFTTTISINGVDQDVIIENIQHIFDLPKYEIVPSSTFTNANDRIMGYYAPQPNMPVKDLKQLIYGVEYPGVQVQGANFNINPGFDANSQFDDFVFDAVQYDEDGIAVIDDSILDTVIRSFYVDEALGARPEDINVDGGAYVDIYSSHAPEELVPGITFDTLNMQVYTKINSNTQVLGYRIFSDMTRDTSYLRIADAYSTYLAQDLNLLDTEIYVEDASKLVVPSPSAQYPGVVFIGGERITYWTIDLDNNVLGQIRRGTQGTGAPELWKAGKLVTDGSAQQNILGVVTGNVFFTSNSAPLDFTNDLTYKIRLTGNVNANVGDIVSQTSSPYANAIVVGRDGIGGDFIYISYKPYPGQLFNSYDYVDYIVGLSGNITVFAGDTITQLASNANVIVTKTAYSTNYITVRYNSYDNLTLATGNLVINGVDANVYPTISNVDVTSATTLLFNGIDSNVRPISVHQQGFVGTTGNGNVEIFGNTRAVGLGNITLSTIQSWYNVPTDGISGLPTDGYGFEGSITAPVLFLKGEVATQTAFDAIQDVITTEDAVNIITEDGQLIIED